MQEPRFRACNLSMDFLDVTPNAQATKAKCTRIKQNENASSQQRKGRHQQNGRQATEQETASANHVSERDEQISVVE